MSVTFGPMPHRSEDWTWFKAMLSAKYILVQYDEEPGAYLVYGYDGPEVMSCTIWKGDVPPGVVAGGYSQAQNDTDKADFEDNYKATANGPLERRETDGRLAVRPIAATQGNIYRLRTFYFKTANAGSLRNARPGGEGYGDVAYKMFDSSGNVTTTGALAVRTELSYEPQYSQEVLGGWMNVDDTIIGGTSEDWWLAAVAAPDIPAQNGGSVDYLSETNIEVMSNSQVRLDGRATGLVLYDPVYHSGVLRIIIQHPLGVQKRFQVFLETFR